MSSKKQIVPRTITLWARSDEVQDLDETFYLSQNQLMKMWGISRIDLYRLRKNEGLPDATFLGKVFIPIRALFDWILEADEDKENFGVRFDELNEAFDKYLAAPPEPTYAQIQNPDAKVTVMMTVYDASRATGLPKSSLVLLGEMEKIRMFGDQKGNVIFDYEDIKSSAAIEECKALLEKAPESTLIEGK